jgi:hypothetical protein
MPIAGGRVADEVTSGHALLRSGDWDPRGNESPEERRIDSTGSPCYLTACPAENAGLVTR